MANTAPPSSLNLFRLGTRGVNVVTAPTHLTDDELLSAQNAEVVSVGGENAIDQRPGMSRINATSLGGSVLVAHDVQAPIRSDFTAYLYAGMYGTSPTSPWRRSSDGVTWSQVTSPTQPFSNNSNIPSYFKNFPKAVTVGASIYYVDNHAPIQLHSFDGYNDSIVGSLLVGVTGTTLASPSVNPPDAQGALSGFPAQTGATSYTYKAVAVAGASHSAAVTLFTTTTGPATLDAISKYAVFDLSGQGGLGTMVPGATQYDIYRTVGGATQGKIGSVPVWVTPYGNQFSVGNGTQGITLGANFYDGGLVGDGTTPPATAAGVAPANALAVLDMITDGTSIYFVTLDSSTSVDPASVGRILAFNTASTTWTQLGAAFPIASGNGTASALAFYDGALIYGTYIGTASGNTSYQATVLPASPLPAGGIPETHTTAASFATCAMAVLNGDIYVGYASLVAATAATIAKRTAPATWSIARTGPGTARYNAYTSLYVFQGTLFAGWTSGDGSSAAKIESTTDGVAWVTEITLATTEVVCQMLEFAGKLYVVLGLTGISYNTTSRILVRSTTGWSVADDPSADFAGCLGIVYL